MTENEKDLTAQTEEQEAETPAEETEEKAEEAEAAEAEEEVKAEAEEEQAEEKKEEPESAPKKKERDLSWTKKAKDKARKAETEKLEAEKAKMEEAVREANDKYARLFAEFDNFRKRSEKEKAAMFGMGARDVIEKILPVLDTLEKGLEGVPEEKLEDPFVVGMDKVHKLFTKTLEDMGVTPIEAVGKEFNPDFHYAVMHVDDESVGENIVVEEFQKGYMYKDTVVRFSMVKVAN